MCKKLAVVALLVAAGVLALQKFDIKCCRKAKSPEQQVQDIRDSIAKLAGEKAKLIDAIAVKEVEVQDLAQEVALREGNLDLRKKRVLALRAEVSAAKELVKAEGDGSFNETRSRLDREYTAFRSAREVLASKKQVHAAARESLDADYQQLSAFEKKRDELTVALDRAEAKLKKVRAAQTLSRQPVDNGTFSRIKAATAKVRKIADVEEKKLDLHSRFPDQPADEPTAKKEGDTLKLLDSDPDFQRK